jgi:hypothetical protein
MRADYANDDTLAEYLKESKSTLFNYFHKYYMNKLQSNSWHLTILHPSPSPCPFTISIYIIYLGILEEVLHSL